MCHLKQGPNWQRARTNCTKALELDPKSVKALFRRGKCNAQLGHLEEAKEDLQRVLQLQPENKDAVREMRGLKAQFATQRKKELKKFAGLFEKLSADEEADAAAPSSVSGGAPGVIDASDGGGVPVATPEAVASGEEPAGGAVLAGGEALAGASGDAESMGDEDDIGEPLGAPETFEPSAHRALHQVGDY